MAACTFFGHRECPRTVRQKLREVMTNLIENHTVDTFYVGRQGGFDAVVYDLLKELSEIYPYIGYTVVLERLPEDQSGCGSFDASETMMPEGMELVPPRFAISRRNDWMLKQSEYVVVYITHSWGGAAIFAQKAERQNKTVINIADRL